MNITLLFFRFTSLQMDLDYDFEDPLLDYVTFQATPATGPDYIISEYLIQKIQRRTFHVALGEYVCFNPEFFRPTAIIQTLSEFLGKYSPEPAPLNFPGTVVSGKLSDECCKLRTKHCNLQSTNLMQLIITDKFNEIHAIGSELNYFVSRPGGLCQEELSWSHIQKFPHNF